MTQKLGAALNVPAPHALGRGGVEPRAAGRFGHLRNGPCPTCGTAASPGAQRKKRRARLRVLQHDTRRTSTRTSLSATNPCCPTSPCSSRLPRCVAPACRHLYRARAQLIPVPHQRRSFALHCIRGSHRSIFHFLRSCTSGRNDITFFFFSAVYRRNRLSFS